MYHEIYLPFPPTINNYYLKSQAGGRFISATGRAFRNDVIQAVSEQLPRVYIDYRVLIETVLFPPDNRIRDVDNYVKPLFDALSHAGVWVDDHLVDQHFNYRGASRRNSSVYVRISEAGPLISDVSQLPES